jgi:hypothetical protein
MGQKIANVLKILFYQKIPCIPEITEVIQSMTTYSTAQEDKEMEEEPLSLILEVVFCKANRSYHLITLLTVLQLTYPWLNCDYIGGNSTDITSY